MISKVFFKLISKKFILYLLFSIFFSGCFSGINNYVYCNKGGSENIKPAQDFLFSIYGKEFPYYRSINKYTYIFFPKTLENQLLPSLGIPLFNQLKDPYLIVLISSKSNRVYKLLNYLYLNWRIEEYERIRDISHQKKENENLLQKHRGLIKKICDYYGLDLDFYIREGIIETREVCGNFHILFLDKIRQTKTKGPPPVLYVIINKYTGELGAIKKY